MAVKTVFIVVQDNGKDEYNEYRKIRVFADSDKATAFFKKMLEKEFKKHNRLVDDNGDDVETCVKYDECLIAGFHHYVDVARYYF